MTSEYKMPGPLLSIIIANFNKELYLGDCLNSILSQSYEHIEIIIADDLSTDSSVEIIKEYEKKFPKKIKCLFNGTHSGVTYTRHHAILNSTGSYITTLDSDDYYFDLRKLEKEMALLWVYKEQKGQDIIAFSNIVLVQENKTMMGIWGTAENIREGHILTPIMGRNCLIPRDFVMSRDAYFHVGGYDLTIPIYEDWDLKIRLAAKYAFYFTGINGTAYRRHGKGLSSLPVPEHEKWLTFIYEKNRHLTDGENNSLIQHGLEEYINLLRHS